jgi:hypothetical protein
MKNELLYIITNSMWMIVAGGIGWHYGQEFIASFFIACGIILLTSFTLRLAFYGIKI